MIEKSPTPKNWNENYFQGRTVDLKTLTLIEEPAEPGEEDLAKADEEFEKLLRESGAE